MLVRMHCFACEEARYMEAFHIQSFFSRFVSLILKHNSVRQENQLFCYVYVAVILFRHDKIINCLP